MRTTKKSSASLAGVNNKAYHQYIISDLIFGVRKKLVKDKKAAELSVLSEISLSELGYETTKEHFSKNHNIDFVVIDEKSKQLLLIAEIEREGQSIQNTSKKIEECLKKIQTIQEAYIIKFDMSGNTSFELCTLEKKNLKITRVKSRSKLLGMDLKRCLVSTRQ